jgi:hypothetical protein
MTTEDDVPEGREQKHKKVKDDVQISPEDLSPIAHPLADGKLVKRLYKTIRRGTFSVTCASVICKLKTWFCSIEGTSGEKGRQGSGERDKKG